MLIKKELLPTGPKNFDFENIPKNGHKIHNDLVNCFIKLMRQKTFTKETSAISIFISTKKVIFVKITFF